MSTLLLAGLERRKEEAIASLVLQRQTQNSCNCSLTSAVMKVAEAAESAVKAFSSKSRIGKTTSSLTAPEMCGRPSNEDSLESYFECQLERSNREQAEATLILFIFLAVFLIGAAISFRKCMKKVSTGINRSLEMNESSFRRV